MRWLDSLKKKKWFGKRKARAAGGEGAGAAKPWDPQRTLLGLKWLVLVLVVGGVVVGWRPAERSLADYVGQQRSQPVTLQNVRLVNAPAWMPLGFRTRLQKMVAGYISPDPMDTLGLKHAAQALLACGWVNRVDRLYRVSGWVNVEAQYRQPAAFVEQRNGYRMIDAQCTLLPGLYQAQHLSMLRIPLIVGASQVNVGVGQKWNDPGLAPALALLSLLNGQPYASEIHAVDISRRDALGRLQLALLCDRGMVLWGLPPGQEGVVEPTAQTKMAWLMQVFRTQGSIDAGGRVVEVNGPAVFIRDSAASAQARTQDTVAAAGYTWAQ